MEMHEKIKALTEQGFNLNTDGDILINDVPRMNDRFDTVFYVHLDDIDLIYIHQYKSNGLRTITDGELLRNHNDCTTNAKKHYEQIMKALPYLSSGYADLKPSETIGVGEVRKVAFEVDPMFITIQILKKKYESLDSSDLSDTSQSTIFDMLYTNPLTDNELTELWEKWQATYDTDTDTNEIIISGDQTQINQLFDLMCLSKRYNNTQKEQYLSGNLFKQKYESLDVDELSESTKSTLTHILYTEPLTHTELTGLWNAWKIKYDSENTHNDLFISGQQTQIDQLFEVLKQSDTYQVEYKKHYLTGMDYDYAVVDRKGEDVMEAEYGGHYMAIIKLINKNHGGTFYDLTQEEKDAFIMSNFDLIGNTYGYKEYYVNSVNESIHWYEHRRK